MQICDKVLTNIKFFFSVTIFENFTIKVWDGVESYIKIVVLKNLENFLETFSWIELETLMLINHRDMKSCKAKIFKN